MKTKEFINGVNELGFEIIRAGSHIDIMFNDFIVAGVYTDQMHVMTFYSHEKLLLTNVDKLFHLLVEYAETPLEDRVEEKKFYLKHRWIVQAGDYKTGFLNYDTNNDILFIYSEHHTHLIKTQFTLKEIEEIKEKFDTDLKDFELVEVEDEN